ncbi:F-box protein CPR1 [Linum grandiflorum]
MSDLIPREITTNILLRLRVRDLVNCRRVSKHWLSVIDDPQFIRRKLHLSLSTNSNFALFRQQRKAEPTVLYSSDDTSSISFSNPIQCDSRPMWLMGSCHGLVCFTLFNYPHDFIIVNPSTGEHHTLSINPITALDELKACGFGYDELLDDYKMVRILETRSDPQSENRSYIAEIYGVRSKGLLTTIPLPSTADWSNCNRMFVGVFFKSSLHWYIQHSAGYPAVHERMIHAIDLVSNTYRELQLPETGFGQVVEFLNVGIVDRRMCLCGFLNADKKFGIWVMDEYENPESWNMIYSFQNIIDLKGPSIVINRWAHEIPQDVMVNILRRLSIKDLASYRRVSKQWLAIIEDPDFIRSQLHRSLSANSNSTLFLQDRRSPTLFYWKQKYPGDTSFFSNLISCDSRAVRLMGSCHGLVCYSLSNYPHGFVVLNPSTGERHTLSNPSNDSRIGDQLLAYGFGYDELSDDYKVVKILCTSSVDPDNNLSYTAEIYGIRSNGFYRTIPLPTEDWNGYLSTCIGVFFGTSLHWCTLNLGSGDNVILAIDLVSNTYRQLQVPQTTLRLDWCLTVGVVDRRLCFCGTIREESKIGIWVMEEYGNLESWNMIYCFKFVVGIGVVPITVIPVGSNGGQILLMADGDIFAWYDPTKNEGETTTRIPTNSMMELYEGIYCTESLVKILPSDVKKNASTEEDSSIDLRNFKALMHKDSSDQE